MAAWCGWWEVWERERILDGKVGREDLYLCIIGFEAEDG